MYMYMSICVKNVSKFNENKSVFYNKENILCSTEVINANLHNVTYMHETSLMSRFQMDHNTPFCRAQSVLQIW